MAKDSIIIDETEVIVTDIGSWTIKEIIEMDRESAFVILNNVETSNEMLTIAYARDDKEMIEHTISVVDSIIGLQGR